MELIFKNISYGSTDLKLTASLYLPEQPRALVFYLHGGGFIFGKRNDLPRGHIDSFLNQDLGLITLDYRLAPEASFEEALSDGIDGVNFFLDMSLELGLAPGSSYFLWGRSAGAFLALNLARHIKRKPKGLLSYYGYGFLKSHWARSPSSYYLSYPGVTRKKAQELVLKVPPLEGELSKRFPIYLQARQSGDWLKLISAGREKEFLEKYSFQNFEEQDSFPRLFLAHSFKDQDVPFLESLEMSKLFPGSTLFSSSSQSHDFDSEDSRERDRLLDSSLSFINSNI